MMEYFTASFFSSKQMNSPLLDVSFDASSLLEDHQLDGADLLEYDEEVSHQSPVKRSGQHTMKPLQTLKDTPRPDLPCLFSSDSNELFQVTHHLRESAQDKHLYNNKIEKLLLSLQQENSSFELDDQLRTRVFRGRFSKDNTLDALDGQLDSYLRDSNSGKPRSPTKKKESVNNDNKENLAPLTPSKRKLSDSQRRNSLKKAKSYTSIPLLQAVSSDSNLAPHSAEANSSPRRLCVPKTTLSPGKPNLRFRKDLSIFLVDSSTGSVNDATQFGTELNSSNCEGFPLPDDVNEVVQIPTNDTTPSSAVHKMAIIKAVLGKQHSSEKDRSRTKKGFYSKQELEDKGKSKSKRGVRIYSDSEKTVRWADDLEW